MEGDQIQVRVMEAIRRDGEDIRHSVAGHTIRDASDREMHYAMRRIGLLPDYRLGETQH
ncbi:MAG: hypothetical protein Q8Q95_02535 [bacterium]|nr:hypothetical protein [bacterium]